MRKGELFELLESEHGTELSDTMRRVVWSAYEHGLMAGSAPFVEFATWVRDADEVQLLDEAYDKAVELVGEPSEVTEEGSDE